jgi:pyruvate/2-oxoglutarate dehydrogenase complex dihydrolipoamide acyltransferase (E2) component
MHKDIKTLGWFWGTIHTIVKQNPKMTIAEALGEGQFWECKTENSHQPFPTERSLRQHFTESHAAYTQEGWEAAARCLNQSWSQIAEEAAEAGAEASEASGRSDREEQNRRNVGEVHNAEQRAVPVPVQVAEQRQIIASESEGVGERGRRRERGERRREQEKKKMLNKSRERHHHQQSQQQ